MKESTNEFLSLMLLQNDGKKGREPSVDTLIYSISCGMLHDVDAVALGPNSDTGSAALICWRTGLHERRYPGLLMIVAVDGLRETHFLSRA